MIGLEPGRNADVARLPEPNTGRPVRPVPDWDAGTPPASVGKPAAGAVWTTERARAACESRDEDSLPASVGKPAAGAVWTTERARAACESREEDSSLKPRASASRKLKRRAALDSIPAGNRAAEGEQ